MKDDQRTVPSKATTAPDGTLGYDHPRLATSANTKPHHRRLAMTLLATTATVWALGVGCRAPDSAEPELA
ncbi:MAG: hypothetical protein AAFS10_23530, partial [Myxococcota bacterium]